MPALAGAIDARSGTTAFVAGQPEFPLRGRRNSGLLLADRLPAVFEARENDIGRNRHPKGIVADEGDLDEDPNDGKPCENKR